MEKIVGNNFMDSELINTSEAYSNSIGMHRNVLIVPYINIELLLGESMFINFSYMIFTDVYDAIDFRSSEALTTRESTNNYKNMIKMYVTRGGGNHSVSELCIHANQSSLYVPPYAKYRNRQSGMFIPFDTPNFDRNMEAGEVTSFLSFDSVTRDLGMEAYLIFSLGV